MRLFLILVPVLGGLLACRSQTPTENALLKEAHRLNQQMETAYRDGRLLDLAAMYRDDGHLLGPGQYHVSGRDGINRYWTNITDPVDWKLEVLAVFSDAEKMFASETWQDFADKPPHWEEYDLELPKDADQIFQLGGQPSNTNGPTPCRPAWWTLPWFG
jgi:hypothetical protein